MSNNNINDLFESNEGDGNDFFSSLNNSDHEITLDKRNADFFNSLNEGNKEETNVERDFFNSLNEGNKEETNVEPDFFNSLAIKKDNEQEKSQEKEPGQDDDDDFFNSLNNKQVEAHDQVDSNINEDLLESLKDDDILQEEHQEPVNHFDNYEENQEEIYEDHNNQEHQNTDHEQHQDYYRNYNQQNYEQHHVNDESFEQQSHEQQPYAQSDHNDYMYNHQQSQFSDYSFPLRSKDDENSSIEAVLLSENTELKQGLINSDNHNVDEDLMPSTSQPEELIPVEHEEVIEYEPLPQNSNENAGEKLETKQIDNLFPDEEDGDFLEDLKQEDKVIDKLADLNLDDDLQQEDKVTDKLADLDFDDDLLLDEEFLEEEDMPEEPIQQTKKYSYVPDVGYQQPKQTSQQQQPQQSQQPTTQNDFIKKLEESKRKNDAYDFPDELVVNKVKPAARHHQSNKYASTVNKTSLSQVPPSPRDVTPTNQPAYLNVPSPTTSNVPVPSSNLPPKKPTTTKSFFEDLPGHEIVKPKRAARTATPVKPTIGKSAMMQNKSPQISNSAPVLKSKKPPINPYQPKSGTSPIFQQHISNTGHSGIAKPPIVPNLSPQNQPINIQPITAFPPVKQQQPAPVNTRLPNVPSTTSPYVPNAGPYAPQNQSQKTHSRANSLVGNKGNNPYAPALTPVISNNQTASASPPITHAVLPPGRVRGFTNNSKNIYKAVPKITNPEEFNKRQFPIFNWTIGNGTVLVMPNKNLHPVISIDSISKYLKDSDLYLNFPGPLIKNKTKKKDIINWLENVSSKCLIEQGRTNELLLNNILLELIHKDGDVKNKEFIQKVCLLLNPNINLNTELISTSGGTTTSYKLDNSGYNTIFTLLQSGNIDKAIEYSISKGDWSIALVLAGPEKFGKIASDYARNTFPFAKSNNNKVLHIMPIILKIIAGNVDSVIQDFNNVSNESEFANENWKEIIASILATNSYKTNEFLIEFGKFLQSKSNLLGAEICFIITNSPFNQQINFMAITSGHNSMYTQIYEYLTCGNYPHLISIKLKHASTLADYGYINDSQKYIDFINSNIKSLNKNSPFITQNLLTEFQNLIIRISESGEISNDQNSWFGKSKVNLDKIWGQIDKFIIGEEGNKSKIKTNSENGVFSKFSPAVSRNASQLDLSSPSPLLKQDSKFHPVQPPLTSYNSTGTDKYSPINKVGRSPFQAQPSTFVNNFEKSMSSTSPLINKAQPYIQPNYSSSSINSAQPSHVKQPSISSVISIESEDNKEKDNFKKLLNQPDTINEFPELKETKPNIEIESEEQLKPPFKEKTTTAPPPPPLKTKPSKNPYAPNSQPKLKPKRSRYGPPETTTSHIPAPAPVPIAASPVQEKNLNIDDSFENTENTSMIDAKPLLLNFESNQLDGFPIPGSPEYTTRANSVLGAHPNIYSSRLSQSQQSALYQQYEVMDDTVRDYIPIQEEDEEEESKPKEQPKKEEPKKTIVRKESTWFKMFKKDDGKPKPIRAKLGEKVNPFYYDEKHKRWLDRTKPIEEQLKVGQTPPPPLSIKKPKSPTQTQTQPPHATSQLLPPKVSTSVSTPTTTESNTNSGPPMPLPKPKISKPKTTSNLANAGLDDLLSMSETSIPKRNKRGIRRNYVNVMEK
ncbi:unnamed protein product [Candida verbasci]|uniref:Protein transport protein sec16 n=1 Tax=Candida verbasci TaxID=1227364 RepID=A0A9W4XF38_9ASCO|nr:unnamed protein product [Candida verbasci]